MFVNDVIQAILELPKQIEELELEIFNMTSKLNDAKEELLAKEAELTLAGEISGKNERERSSKLYTLTVDERKKIKEIEKELSSIKIKHERAVNDFKAYRAIAPLFRMMITEKTLANDFSILSTQTGIDVTGQ